jgi:hypothetical protein
MNLYSSIKEFQQYLTSMRVAENFLFIDLVLPKSWLIPQSYMQDKFVLTFQIKNDNEKIGITFVIEDKEESFNIALEKIFKIIRDNQEIEQKSILLNKNIDILKTLFSKNRLDDLNKLEFLIPEKPFENETGENAGNTTKRKKA